MPTAEEDAVNRTASQDTPLEAAGGERNNEKQTTRSTGREPKKDEYEGTWAVKKSEITDEEIN